MTCGEPAHGGLLTGLTGPVPRRRLQLVKRWTAVAAGSVALALASAGRAERFAPQHAFEVKAQRNLPDWLVSAGAYGRSGNPFADFDVGLGVKQSLNVELSSLANDARGLESVSLSGQQRFAVDVSALLASVVLGFEAGVRHAGTP